MLFAAAALAALAFQIPPYRATVGKPTTLPLSLPAATRAALTEQRDVEFRLQLHGVSGSRGLCFTIQLADQAGLVVGEPWAVSFGHEPGKPANFVFDATDEIVRLAARPKFDPARVVVIITPAWEGPDQRLPAEAGLRAVGATLTAAPIRR